VQGFGWKYPKNLHSQIAFFNKGRLPGGLAAGPVSREKLNLYKISFERKDEYELFQTDAAVYRDDRMDFITNEPTIVANATAVFVLGTRN
jgi:hypothetical protein